MASPRPDESASGGKPGDKSSSRASREAIDDESDSNGSIDMANWRRDRERNFQRRIEANNLAELRIIEKFNASRVGSTLNEATQSRKLQDVTRRSRGIRKDAKGESESVSVTFDYRFLPLTSENEGGGIYEDERALFELFTMRAGRPRTLTSTRLESVFVTGTGVLNVSGEILVPWKLDKIFIKTGPYPAKEALAHLELDLSIVAALESEELVEFMAMPKERGAVIDKDLLKNYDPVPYEGQIGKKILPFTFALNILAASEKRGLNINLGRGFLVKVSIMAIDEDGEKYAVDVRTDKPVWMDTPGEECKEAIGYSSTVQEPSTSNSPESASTRKHRSESLTREDPAKRPKSDRVFQEAGIETKPLLSMLEEVSDSQAVVCPNLFGGLASNLNDSLHRQVASPLPQPVPSKYVNVTYHQNETAFSSGAKSTYADDTLKDGDGPLGAERHFGTVMLDIPAKCERHSPGLHHFEEDDVYKPKPSEFVHQKPHESFGDRFRQKSRQRLSSNHSPGSRPSKASHKVASVVGSTESYQGTKVSKRREDIVLDDPNRPQTIVADSNVVEVPLDQSGPSSTRSLPFRASFRVRVTNIARKVLQKGPLPSHHRLEWTCGCGEKLYADINKRSGAEIARLAAILQCTHSIPAQSSTSLGANAVPIHRPPLAMIPGRSPSSSISSLGLSSAPLLGSSPSNSSYEAGTSISPNKSYLELCINTGEYTKTLSEIDLAHVNCDGELFRRIRSEYLRLRSFRSKIWLLKPSGVHFVKFAVQNHHRVGILQKPLSIPPQHEVDAKNYFYTPCPLQDDPPMPEDIFLHYLSCTEFDPSPAWLPRLPKKLDPSILRFTGAINEGWGIHINEGPNWSALGWINLVVMILSGLAAGLWKYYMDDFQGAFGFAGWIVAVVNAVLVAWIAKWSQQ